MNETILSFQSPLGVSYNLVKSVWDGGSVFQSLSIVSGLHGDQINGLYVTSKLSQFMEAVEEGTKNKFRLRGKVQIFPTVNGLALEAGTASWPFDGINLDLAFPGNRTGETTEKICHAILKHTTETSWGIVFESPPLHYDCLPHVRLFKPDRTLKKLSGALNLGIGRIAGNSEIPPTQLMRYWMERDIPALSIVCGKLNLFDPHLMDHIVSGLINLLLMTGIFGHSDEKYQKSDMRFFDSSDEQTLPANNSGLFIPKIRIGDFVKEGQLLGILQNVGTGKVLEEILCPVQGDIFTLRNHPLIYEKEPLVVILKKKKNTRFWPF